MTKTSKVAPNYSMLVLAIIVLAIVVVLLISLGRIDLSRNKHAPKEKDPPLDDRIETIKKQHGQLEQLIASQKNLLEKLKRKFKIVYFLARLIILAVWLVLNWCLSLFGIAKTLEDFLNINQVVVIGFVAIIYLFSGGLSGISELIRYAKDGIENRVYKKHLTLRAEIETNSAKADELLLELARIENQSGCNNKVILLEKA
jgi:hypothetical protein